MAEKRTKEDLANLLASKSNKWKDDKSRWRTRSLFWEYAHNAQREQFTPPYTIHDEDIVRDGITYVSLKRLYMTYDHVPGFEYEFANNHLGGWAHFQTIVNGNTILASDISKWREELEVKRRAEAIKAMIRSSKEDGPKAFSASKYLANKEYSPARGRPSKEEVEREKRIQAGITDELSEDMDRIGLSLVNSK